MHKKRYQGKNNHQLLRVCYEADAVMTGNKNLKNNDNEKHSDAQANKYRMIFLKMKLPYYKRLFDWFQEVFFFFLNNYYVSSILNQKKNKVSNIEPNKGFSYNLCFTQYRLRCDSFPNPLFGSSYTGIDACTLKGIRV